MVCLLLKKLPVKNYRFGRNGEKIDLNYSSTLNFDAEHISDWFEYEIFKKISEHPNALVLTMYSINNTGYSWFAMAVENLSMFIDDVSYGSQVNGQQCPWNNRLKRFFYVWRYFC